MKSNVENRPPRSVRHRIALVFERQARHVVLLALLLAGTATAAAQLRLNVGQFGGLSTKLWFLLAIALPIAHQVYVWFCWRTELHLSLLSRMLGRGAFRIYAVGFSILGIARVAAVFCLAFSNRDTVSWAPTLLQLVGIVVMIPALYLFYSVKRYFTATRAFGIDHFDPAYREIPFVRKGIFRFTQNGMYTYGFLILWAPALFWASRAALFAALFNHLYIWVHYYVTEKPDMQRIYGKPS